MATLPRHSIARQLTRLNLVVSGTALTLTFVALAVLDGVSFGRDMVRALSVRAQIIASNSGSALTFNDAGAAENTLAALAAAPEIVNAEVYTTDGTLFAAYRRATDPAGRIALPINGLHSEAYVFTRAGIALARPIVFDGTPLGVVYIHSDLSALIARLQGGLGVLALVVVLALLASLVASRQSQRAIAVPLMQLADMARRVASDQDYAVRVGAADRTYEVAILIDSFNEMLTQIERRERALTEAHDQLEERVRQRTNDLNAANAELEAFSYSVSHDLRAPLRHITGFASLLERHTGASLDERGRHDLQRINDAASRMGRLIDDLLAFSRMGRASLKKARVDLAGLVRDAKAEVMNDTAGREVRWRVDALPAVDGDPALLRPVFVNLLSNALKYSGTRPVSEIEVGAREGDRGQVVVYVRDNGVGFDMQYVSKLFGVFQRLHRADEFSGTGIGLANVKRIVERHGGRAWAEGQVDAGATFYISLPAAERAASMTARVEPQPALIA